MTERDEIRVTRRFILGGSGQLSHETSFFRGETFVRKKICTADRPLWKSSLNVNPLANWSARGIAPVDMITAVLVHLSKIALVSLIVSPLGTD